MATLDEIRTIFKALSESDRKAFLKEVSPRGPAPLQPELVYQAVHTILEELTTNNYTFYDRWLFDLTLEELEELVAYPTSEEREKYLTHEELEGRPPLKRLSLIGWLWTAEGRIVFKRDGLELFYEWGIQQTEKLIRFKKLTVQDLLKMVEHKLGRPGKKREHAVKGELLKWVHITKDKFFARFCFDWEQIPQGLHLKRQRGARVSFYHRHRADYHRDMPPLPYFI